MRDDQDDFTDAKNGNSLAFKKLFSRYQPVVFKLKSKYSLKEFDEDDWLQEGRIVFFKSLTTYNASQGLTFGCFFRMNFERHVISLLRKQHAEKRKTELISDSLEESIAKYGDPFIVCENSRQTSAFQYIFIRDELHGFQHELSPFESNVFKGVLAAKEIPVIGYELQCAESQVKNAIDRIKRKFKYTIQ